MNLSLGYIVSSRRALTTSKTLPQKEKQAEEMVQWCKYLPDKQKNWSSNPYRNPGQHSGSAKILAFEGGEWGALEEAG